MGGSGKLTVLPPFSTVFNVYADIVGGSEKVQNNADVMS